MKKIFFAIFFVALCVVVALTGCNTSKSYEGVEELADDSTFRPGATVDVPTVLDFNATWCGPCQQFKPVFHAAAEKFDHVHFVSVDVDSNPETAAAFGVTAIPTVVFIGTDGSEQRFIGTEDLLPKEKFEALVEELTK